MGKTVKQELKRLTYVLYFLSVFVLGLGFFRFLAQDLVGKWGPRLLGKDLGPAVMQETLQLFFVFLGGAFVLFLLLSFFHLHRVFKGVDQLETSMKEGADKTYALGQILMERVGQLSQHMQRQNERLLSASMDSQWQLENGEKQKREINDFVESFKDLKNNFGEQAATTGDQGHESSGEINAGHGPDKMEQGVSKLQEILFQAQLAAFNASTASSGKGGQHHQLMKNLESFLEEGSYLMDEIMVLFSKEKRVLTDIIGQEKTKQNESRQHEQHLFQQYQNLLGKAQELTHRLEHDSKKARPLSAQEANFFTLNQNVEGLSGPELGQGLLEMAHDLKELGLAMGRQKSLATEVMGPLPGESEKRDAFITDIN